MAVYKRTYRGYSGPLTNPTWRFLLLRRYAFRSIFRSRFLLVGYVACFFAPLVMLCLLYLNQNASVLALIRQKPGFIQVNGAFFYRFLMVQGGLATLLTAFVGPSLVAPDLTNGALPMYLSRPFSRTEYILGKGSVLGTLIASITMIPGLLLFVVQSSLMGWSWFSENLYLGIGVLLSTGLLMGVLILLGLAMSAFIRWRIAAGALVIAAFAAGKGFGAVINNVMRTSGGYYIDLQHLLAAVAGGVLRYGTDDEPISLAAAVMTTLMFCGCLLVLINRKLRVCEVAG